jgi:hypothetical protein
VRVFLAVPLFLEWFKGARESGWGREQLVRGASLARVPWGLLGYMAYL